MRSTQVGIALFPLLRRRRGWAARRDLRPMRWYRHRVPFGSPLRYLRSALVLKNGIKTDHPRIALGTPAVKTELGGGLSWLRRSFNNVLIQVAISQQPRAPNIAALVARVR